jgi:hypothetical protein
VFLLAGVTDFMSSFQVIGDDLKVIIRLVWLFYLNPALVTISAYYFVTSLASVSKFGPRKGKGWETDRKCTVRTAFCRFRRP